MVKTTLIFLFFLIPIVSKGNLIINEIVCGSTDDWVELKLKSTNEIKKSIDISNLYVTMYYGTNEHLANSPVTICSYDKKETPYNDKFVVIHLANPSGIDETDETGDSNGNGYLDIYCNNYYASLWNSDGVVSIDNDDNPSNNGIIDFVAYSNQDGSPNRTISSYIQKASLFNQWQIKSEDIQHSSFYIGKSGLSSYMSISRKDETDLNNLHNFEITKFQTPGNENIFSGNKIERKMFSLSKNKVFLIPNSSQKSNLILKIYELCNIKYRIFSSTGFKVYESKYLKNSYPQILYINLKESKIKKPGLYFGKIEATSNSLKSINIKTFYLIVCYKK